MLQRVRRVVTGINEQGKSSVLFDGPAETRVENPAWPGNGVSMLWLTDKIPACNAGADDAAARPFLVEPLPGGTIFTICEFRPESDLEKMTPEQRMAAKKVSGFDNVRTAPDVHPGMHATKTLDYLIALKGQLTLILEDGEVTLHPFDTLVDRGVIHAWENRGDSPALFAVILVDAAG